MRDRARARTDIDARAEARPTPSGISRRTAGPPPSSRKNFPEGSGKFPDLGTPLRENCQRARAGSVGSELAIRQSSTSSPSMTEVSDGWLVGGLSDESWE